MTKKKSVERRKRKRSQVPKDAFVALGPHYVKLGQMMDVSTHGLAFCYMASEEPSDGSFELDIFLAGSPFYLSYVPFKAVSDSKISNNPSGSLTTRRCSVQFGELTPHHRSQLDYFIRTYNIADVWVHLKNSEGSWKKLQRHLPES